MIILAVNLHRDGGNPQNLASVVYDSIGWAVSIPVSERSTSKVSSIVYTEVRGPDTGGWNFYVRNSIVVVRVPLQPVVWPDSFEPGTGCQDTSRLVVHVDDAHSNSNIDSINIGLFISWFLHWNSIFFISSISLAKTFSFLARAMPSTTMRTRPLFIRAAII